jgi:hypothetical protein
VAKHWTEVVSRLSELEWKRGGTHVVTVSVGDRVGLREGLVLRAAISDVVGAGGRVGELVQGGTSANVAGVDAGSGAETAGGHLVVEGRAVVDIGGGDEGVSDDTGSASAVRIRAIQGARRAALRRNTLISRVGEKSGEERSKRAHVEYGSDSGSRGTLEVGFVEGVAGSAAVDVVGSNRGKRLGL